MRLIMAATEQHYEWCVMHSAFPEEPHRGPWSEAEARAWIDEAILDGFKMDAFYLARRPVGDWEKADHE